MQTPEIFSIDNAHNSISELEVVEVPHFQNNFTKFLFNLKNYFLEYCSVSSIGGLIHLNLFGNLHRIFWCILLLVAVVSCYFTNVLLLGAREVLILNEDNTMSTSEIPFPAVTVCTTVKVDHRIFNKEYANIRFHDLTEKE